MLNLDPAKLLVILVVAFVVLGPDRLPRVARQLGSAWRELTRLRAEVTDEVRSAFPTADLPHIPNASAAVSGFVSNMTSPLRSMLDGRDVSPASPNGSTTSEPVGGAAVTEAVPVPRPALPRQPSEEFTVFSDDPSMN